MASIGGYAYNDVIYMVQRRTNEASFAGTDIILFANRGLERLVVEVGAIFEPAIIPLAISQGTFTLPGDMQEVESMSFSAPAGALTQPGVTVYPVKPRSQEIFFDLAGGQPTVGGGAPLEYFITTDASGAQSVQVYPLPTMAGQINLYYRKRPVPWSVTYDPHGVPTYVSTDVDQAWQELAILWACKCVCEAVEAFDKVNYFDAEYKSQLELAKVSVARRRRTKQTVVKDVYEDYTAWPSWVVGSRT